MKFSPTDLIKADKSRDSIDVDLLSWTSPSIPKIT